MASRVTTVSGTGTSRTTTFVAMPSVPSEPMKRPRRSYPTGSGPWLPSHSTSPLAVTTSMPMTWFVVTPSARQCGPPAFSATFPPIVQAFWLLGSGA